MVTVHVAAVVAGRCVHCGARADNTTGDWCSRTRTGSGMARFHRFVIVDTCKTVLEVVEL